MARSACKAGSKAKSQSPESWEYDGSTTWPARILSGQSEREQREMLVRYRSITANCGGLSAVVPDNAGPFLTPLIRPVRRSSQTLPIEVIDSEESIHENR